jgi:transposase InsO family protein
VIILWLIRHIRAITAAYLNFCSLSTASQSTYSSKIDELMIVRSRINLSTVFYRYIQIEPQTSLDAKSTLEAFQSIYNRLPGRTSIRRLFTDRASCFTSPIFVNGLRKMGISIYHPLNSNKACFAERGVRTIRRILAVYRHSNRTNRFVDVLDKLVYLYNTRISRSLPPNMSPLGM